MSDAANETKILVTGFGPFLDVTINPSFEITQRLPPSIPAGTIPTVYTNVSIIAHPEPLRAAYHSLLETAPRLINEYNPDIVLHIGLAVDRDYFGVEQSACRDGYHQYPDMERRVISKVEGGTKMWGKDSKERLESSLDLAGVVESWRRNIETRSRRKKGKGGRGNNGKTGATGGQVDVRLSDDVGDYVCGLVYYASLAEMAKRKGDSGKKVVFLHVPPLKTEEEVTTGVDVVMALIAGLAESL